MASIELLTKDVQDACLLWLVDAESRIESKANLILERYSSRYIFQFIGKRMARCELEAEHEIHNYTTNIVYSIMDLCYKSHQLNRSKIRLDSAEVSILGAYLGKVGS